LTDTIDYRTIGFSHNRPNPTCNVINKQDWDLGKFGKFPLKIPEDIK